MGSKNVQNGHEIMIFKNDDFSMANDGNILIFMDLSSKNMSEGMAHSQIMGKIFFLKPCQNSTVGQNFLVSISSLICVKISLRCQILFIINMRLKDSKQCMVDNRYIPKHFQKLAKGY